MITFTGTHVTKEFGAPNIRDISVGLMRTGRFGGASQKVWFWPVGLHCLAVAKLLPARLKAHGLLHDADETCTGDIPQPLKTEEQRVLQHRLLERTYDLLGVNPPNVEDSLLIHEVDMRVVCAEGYLGCGPRGFIETQRNCQIDTESVAVVTDLMARYGNNPMEALNPNGHWPLFFEQELRLAIRDLRHQTPMLTLMNNVDELRKRKKRA